MQEDPSRIPPWSEYQERTADLFRSMGFDADTNVDVSGVRTSHNVDVVVQSAHAGFEILWLVECKHWSTRITKLHVLALREIVLDAGADRGLLIAESGFQSGAKEAARLTNVRLTSLADLEVTASHDIGLMNVQELLDRAEACRDRYWAIDKETRIAQGLRPPVMQFGYSTVHTLDAAEAALHQGLRGSFPILTDRLVAAKAYPELTINAASLRELVLQVEPLIRKVEDRLDERGK